MTGERNMLRGASVVAMVLIMALSMLAIGFAGSAAAIDDEESSIVANPADPTAEDVTHTIFLEGDEDLEDIDDDSKDTSLLFVYEGADGEIDEMNDLDADDIAIDLFDNSEEHDSTISSFGSSDDIEGATFANEGESFDDSDDVAIGIELDGGSVNVDNDQYLRISIQELEHNDASEDGITVNVGLEDDTTDIDTAISNDNFDAIDEDLELDLPGVVELSEEVDDVETFSSVYDAAAHLDNENAEGVEIEVTDDVDEFTTQSEPVDGNNELETIELTEDDTTLTTEDGATITSVGDDDDVLEVNGADGVIIENVEFDADSDFLTAEADRAIATANSPDDLIIDAVEFVNFEGDEVIDLNPFGDDVEITNNVFEDISVTNEIVTTTDLGGDVLVSANTLEDGIAHGTDAAIVVNQDDEEAEEVTVSENVVDPDEDDGIHVTAEAEDVEVSNNVIKESGSDDTGIEINVDPDDSAETLTVHNNSIAFNDNSDVGVAITHADSETDVTIGADDAEIGGEATSESTAVDLDSSDFNADVDIDGLLVVEADLGVDLSNDDSATEEVEVTGGNFSEIDDTAIHIANDGDLEAFTATDVTIHDGGDGIHIEDAAADAEIEVTGLTAEEGVDTALQIDDGDVIDVDETYVEEVSSEAINLNSDEASDIEVTATEINGTDGQATEGVVVEQADESAEVTITDVEAADVDFAEALVRINDDEVRHLEITDVTVDGLEDGAAVAIDEFEEGEELPTLGDYYVEGTDDQDGDVLVINTDVNEDFVGEDAIADIEASNVSTGIELDGVVSGDDIEITDFEFVDVADEAINVNTDVRELHVHSGTIEGVAGTGVDVQNVDDDGSTTIGLEHLSIEGDDGDGTGVNVDIAGEAGEVEAIYVEDVHVSDAQDGFTFVGDDGDNTEAEEIALSEVSATDGDGDGISVEDFELETFGVYEANISANDGNGVLLTESASGHTVIEDAEIAWVEANDLESGAAVHVHTDLGDGDIETLTVHESGVNNSEYGVEIDSSDVDVVEIEESAIDNTTQAGVATDGGEDHVNVTESSFDGNDVAIDASDDPDNVKAVYNTFTDSEAAAIQFDGNHDSINASSNYWGAETGPEVVDDGPETIFAGNGDALVFTDDGPDIEDVEFTPFLNADYEEVVGFEGTVYDADGDELDEGDVDFAFEHVSDGEGTFTYEEVDDGMYVAVTSATGLYDVTANADGYAESDEEEVYIASGDYLSFGDEFELNEGGELNGTVHGPDGEPLAEGEELNLTDADTGDVLVEDLELEADGEYETALTPGDYTVQFESDDYPTSSAADVTLESGEATSQNFTLGGQLNGTVHDPDGEVLNDTIVELIDADEDETLETVTTDENGTYVANLTAGDHSLQVDNDSYDASDVENVSIEEGEMSTQNFTVAEDTTATLEATVEDADGDAVDETDVTFSADDADFEETVETDSDGQATLEVPSGEYQLTASAEDVGEDTRTLDIRTSESISLTFTLEEVDDDEKTVDDYRNEDDEVDTDGLREAIADWRSDDIDVDLLRDVIAEWRAS